MKVSSRQSRERSRPDSARWAAPGGDNRFKAFDKRISDRAPWRIKVTYTIAHGGAL